MFARSDENKVYGPGHNSFTTSPDGTEDWIVYHGKDWRDADLQGFAGRMTRAQRFTWRADGPPDFGHPIAVTAWRWLLYQDDVNDALFVGPTRTGAIRSIQPGGARSALTGFRFQHR